MLAQAKRRAKRPAQKRRLTELFVRKTKPRDSESLVWDTYQTDWRCGCSRPGPRHGSSSTAVMAGRAGCRQAEQSSI